MSKVLIASSVGPGKQYAAPILEETLNNLVKPGYEEYIVADGVELEFADAVLKEPTEELTRVQRIARVRSKIRGHFLKGDCTHLFFLDADIVTPTDAVDRLLSDNVPIATGLYPLRDFSSVEIPMVINGISGKTIYGPRYLVDKAKCFGMGCMLVTREVVKRTKFREGEALTSTGEDYAFCMDSGEDVLMDHEVNCWHVHSNMVAGRFKIEEVKAGVVWEGSARYAINRYGKWERGVPRYNLSSEKIAKLGPEFKVGEFTPVKVETRNYADIVLLGEE